MRDINRIDTFCDKLKEYWKEVPDWRFGQLMVNVFSFINKDPFFMEEDEMLKYFDALFKKNK